MSQDRKVEGLSRIGFFRMRPRAFFHMREGKKILESNLNKAGVYILYRDEVPYYIGKTKKPLVKRLRSHALRPNSRRYNFWNYFSAFEIEDESHMNEVEAILISAMPTANSSKPKFDRKKHDKDAMKLLNRVQSLRLIGKIDESLESEPEGADEDED